MLGYVVVEFAQGARRKSINSSSFYIEVQSLHKRLRILVRVDASGSAASGFGCVSQGFLEDPGLVTSKFKPGNTATGDQRVAVL